MGIATAAALVVGTGVSMYAANKASKAQVRAADSAADSTRDAAEQSIAAQERAAAESIAAQERMFQRQVELQEPFRQTGLTAQNRMLTLLGLSGGTASSDFGRYARDFSESDFKTDPGYGFRLSEGMKALERSAAARGGLLSGATIKGAIRFGQDTASSEYMNAFNRYQTNRFNQLNPLQSLMGAGQSSANVLSNAAGQTGAGLGSTYMSLGQGMSNIYMGRGQGVASAQLAGGAARASGYASMANSFNSGLSTAANLNMQAPVYNAMTGYYNRGNPAPPPQPQPIR